MKKYAYLLAAFIICLFAFKPGAQTTASFTNEVLASINSEDNIITVQWQTAREVNSGFFIVERSFDGIIYDISGTKRAAGNSMFPRNYEVNDLADTGSKVFYRVVLVTMNGDRITSNVLSFDPAPQKTIQPEMQKTASQPVVQK